MNAETIHNRIQEGSEQLEEKRRAMVDRAKQAVAVIGEYVHEKPWVPIGMVAAVALFVGFLIGQRER